LRRRIEQHLRDQFWIQSVATSTRLIFGCGYLGLRVARRWRQQGDIVVAITRSGRRAEELARFCLTPRVADVTDGDSLADLPAAATVLYAVGHDRSAGMSVRDVFVGGLKNVLAALPAETGRMVYISSTGVYGQNEGEWVDESSPCRPTREGGCACLDAEHLLQEHALGKRAVILRMGGLYGPGRIPRRRELHGGEPIAAPEHGYLNLIHVEDAAEIVATAAARSPAPSLYNVTDGHPVLRGDYFREAARVMGAPSPQFLPPPENDPRAQRAASDKRVSNRALVMQLQPTFRYRSYREGLAAIAAEE
jgi:nucleoside-diphosphate-sugar epimerase